MGISAMKLPQISIITISYNAVEFIEQTIRSVLTQSYPLIEYIIIDGGSTDGTTEIIQHYAASLAYWHSRQDRGIAHAFNLGLAQAQGEWILYLNADDLLLDPSVIEQMASHLLYHQEADVVFGNMLSLTREKNPQPVPFCKVGGHPWRWREFRKLNMIPHQAAFTRRHYFERVGSFDESFRIAMDYELFLRAGEGLRAQFVPSDLVGMRAGGQCVKNKVDTWREFRRAQIKNRVLPKWFAELNFYLQVGRIYLGIMAHVVLDPWAGTIRWPGRN
ncbi:MAG: glycosyltransferase family 2 protein [Deltaproteobacteria bacterium]|nr:glycosyltransferase family 2 protein [Deltaproteobacteria bacterium]